MVTQRAAHYAGYVVEATEGLCLAAFADPLAAVVWAVECGALMRGHNWDSQLMDHEVSLCDGGACNGFACDLPRVMWLRRTLRRGSQVAACFIYAHSLVCSCAKRL
jgi:hypothetical protein